MQQVKEHGFSVGISRVDDAFFMKIKAIGKLTHGDYEMMIPMLEKSIEGIQHPDIKIVFDATEFNGWELRAAWDDFKFGMKHLTQFKKMAVIGNKKWHEFATKVAGWFMITSEIEYFENMDDVSNWIKG